MVEEMGGDLMCLYAHACVQASALTYTWMCAHTHTHIHTNTFTHKHALTHVFCSPGVNGVQMFGVGHDAVVYLVEQLAGAAHCRQYKFRYQKHELPEDEVCPCLVWCCCLWWC